MQALATSSPVVRWWKLILMLVSDGEDVKIEFKYELKDAAYEVVF